MAKRFPHYLKPNKRNERPSNVIFVDTETKPEPISEKEVEHKLWFGWAMHTTRRGEGKYDDPSWFRFADTDIFWSWVISHTREKAKTYLFAHNVGFDGPVLRTFTTLYKLGYKLHSPCMDDPPTYLLFRRGKVSIQIVDTLNYFRMSLAELGKQTGLNKLEMPSQGDSEDTWDVYCKRDVQVLFESMRLWWDTLDKWNLGNAQLTLASQAFTAYRHRFMREAIFIDDSVNALSLARRSYMGGRNEAFKIGHYSGKYYQLDINSQYPFVMAEGEYPTKLVSVYNEPEIKKIGEWLRTYAVIADVEVLVNEPCIPKREGDKLIFPLGRFRTALAGPELELAYRRSYLTHVYEAGIYERAPLFREFVDFFYSRRREFIAEGNQGMAFVFKILMNSLYGKFGQNGRKWEDYGETDTFGLAAWTVVNAQTGKIERRRQIGSVVQRMLQDGEAAESHPAIASYITSYARVYLWSLIESATMGHTYYVDTDSILVSHRGMERLSSKIDNTRLGGLKIETQADEIHIRGLKDYTIGSKRKVKGIRKNAIQLDENTFLQDQFRNLKGMIRKGDGERVIVKRVRKTLSRKYTKGSVRDDGRITPLILNQP